MGLGVKNEFIVVKIIKIIDVGIILVGNNYFLNWISALVKEMGGNLFRNYGFDFYPRILGLDQVKNRKKCDFLTSFENHTYFLCFSLDLTQNTREKSNS